MTIDERWQAVGGRPAGFDYMRLGLSVAVLLWHSYQMSYGTAAALSFWETSPAGWVLQLILPMFFALSGYLVSSSLIRNPSIPLFLGLRAIRIFPALCVEIILSAFILGPLLTNLSLAEYFSNWEFFSYLTNVFGWVHYNLPGVFLRNPTPRIVNSSLWTIPFELEAYILISILALLGMFKRRVLVLPLFAAATAFVAAYNLWGAVDPSPAGGVNGRVLVLCFFGGIIINSYKDKLPWRADLAIGSIVVAAFFTWHGSLVYLTPIFAAYATVYLGLTNPPRSIAIDSGDYSYGVYLYAGPIQQTVSYLLGSRVSWGLNVSIALPFVVTFALFSWWYIEKPVLKVRKFMGAKPSPHVETMLQNADAPIDYGIKSRR